DLGGLFWFVGIWVTMMAAMMLPSAAPMVLVFSRLNYQRAVRDRTASVPTWIFVAGYLIAWTAYGLIAYAVYRVARDVAPHFLAWSRGGRFVAGGALVLAGLYELTPIKEVCLHHCRGPMHLILRGWRAGAGGALRMGVEHGSYCVGCCWGLMLGLFALGVMSLTWMAVVAGLIFVQKVLPRGDRLAPAFRALLVAGWRWGATSPSTVPGLPVSIPDASSMQMG